jgi:hypothetical protein
LLSGTLRVFLCVFSQRLKNCWLHIYLIAEICDCLDILTSCFLPRSPGELTVLSYEARFDPRLGRLCGLVSREFTHEACRRFNKFLLSLSSASSVLKYRLNYRQSIFTHHTSLNLIFFTRNPKRRRAYENFSTKHVRGRLGRAAASCRVNFRT